MPTKTLLRGALALAIVLAAPVAYAADSTSVVVPWGDWVGSLLASIGTLTAAVLVYIVKTWAPSIVKTFLTDKVISDAVNYGLGAIEGAVAGKELDLKTTNAVLTAAANYAVSLEPNIAAWLGGNLRPALLSKLSALGAVPAAATASATSSLLSGAPRK